MKSYGRNHFHTALQILFDLTDLFAQKRMKEIYKLKGYSDDWIEKRVRGISIRDKLTDEWDKRGTKTKKEYSILTAAKEMDLHMRR